MFGILTFGIFRPFALLSFREDTSFTVPHLLYPQTEFVFSQDGVLRNGIWGKDASSPTDEAARC